MDKRQVRSKPPLYRSVNTRARNVKHDFGGDYRWSRRTGEDRENLGSMHSNARRGRDYTPLFRFLLSRVGKDWSQAYSEAVSRLDDPKPIFWIVARSEAEKRAFVRMSESSYYSGLYVDEHDLLAVVDPSLTVEQMEPSCACCTHTFNGVPFVRKFAAT